MSASQTAALVLAAVLFAYGCTVIGIRAQELTAKIEVQKACTDYYAGLMSGMGAANGKR